MKVIVKGVRDTVRGLRYLHRFGLYVYRSIRPAYRLAETWGERASIIRLGAKFTAARAFEVASRVIRHRFLQEDTVIRVRGATYCVGTEAREVSVFEEIYNDHDYDRIERFIPASGWTVVDVGANIGVFAIQQALRGARVYAFEPNPDCYRRLSKAAQYNGLADRLSAFNVALGSRVGTGVLDVPQGCTPVGSVVLSSGAGSRGPTVSVTTLDTMVDQFGIERIDLLKIDTEGAEVEVLRGGMAALRAVQRLVVEYHSVDNLASVRSIVRDHGFSELLRVDTDAAAGVGIIYAERAGAGCGVAPGGVATGNEVAQT